MKRRKGRSRSYYSVSLNYRTFVEINKKRNFLFTRASLRFTRTQFYFHYMDEFIRLYSVFSPAKKRKGKRREEIYKKRLIFLLRFKFE